MGFDQAIETCKEAYVDDALSEWEEGFIDSLISQQRVDTIDDLDESRLTKNQLDKLFEIADHVAADRV